VATRSAIKIGVKQPGWYRVEQAALLDAGFNPSTDKQLLHLYADGTEQAMSVVGDAIEFYGTGLDTLWADTKTYWLAVESQPGQRLGSSSITGTPGDAGFPFQVKHQEELQYVSGIMNGDADNFFGAPSWNGPVNDVFAVHHLDSTSSDDALLEVAMQGVNYVSHQITVNWNGVPKATISFQDHNTM